MKIRRTLQFVGAILQLSKLPWQLVGFVIWACPSTLFSQQLSFEHWSTDNGLSNNWVSDVLHDSRGFVWVATQYGVNQFDGHEFRLFRCNPNDPNSLKSNWVRSMAEGADGNLWFGTYGGGLARFNPFLEKFTRFTHDPKNENSLPDNEMYKVFAAHDKRLWVATSKGVAWSMGDSIFHRVTNSPAFEMREDKQKVLWLAAQDGLYFWRNDRFNPIPVLKDQAVYSVFPCPFESGKYWICTKKGLQLLELRAGTWHLSASYLPQQSSPNRFFFQSVFLDSQHRIWAGTSQGVFMDEELDAPANWPSHLPPILPHNLHAASEDPQGNVWLCTNKGIFVLKASARKFKTPAWGAALQGIPAVREVLQWKDETWVAVPDGLYAWKADHRQKILDASINGLLLAADGLVYAAPANQSPAGIFRIRPDSKSAQFLPFPAEEKNRLLPRKVWSLVQDKKGGIWVGAQGCLYRFDPMTDIFRPFFCKGQEEQNDIFIDLKLDEEGHLWAGTLKSGLFFIENPALNTTEKLRFKNYTFEENNPNSLSSSIAEAVCVSKNGVVWIGTDAGLNRLDPATDKVRRYLREDGLRDEKIMGIVEDDAGRLWVSTAGHGISCLDTSQVFWHFDKKEGLVSNDFLLGSAYQRKDGVLVFGAEDGLQIFHPDSVAPRKTIFSPVYFTSFFVANDAGKKSGSDIGLDSSIHFAKSITIPAGHQTLTFNFAALCLEQAANLQYAYRLAPLNPTWQPVGSAREITLTQVPPGKHTLEIRATGGHLPLEGVSNSLQLDILPEWHQSLPARISGALIVLLGLFWVYRFRVKRKLAAAETRRLRELDLVKNRLYTNITHEFRTPITLINGMSERLQGLVDFEARDGLNMIRRNGQQLLDLVNQLLDLAKLESGTMHLSMVQGDVVVFLKYLFESFHSIADTKNISLYFATKMESFTIDYDPEKLRQIVTNLLSNAVKFTPLGGSVEMKLEVGSAPNSAVPHFIISVSDTGPGIPPEKQLHIFERFYQLDDSSTRHAEGTGIGLTLAKELAKLFGGDITIASEIGHGATFTVKLPISRNAEMVTEVAQGSTYLKDFLPTMAEVANHEALNRHTTSTIKLPLLTILIIEDNVDVVKYITAVLKKDYQLLTAPNGKLGLELAKKEIPDLVLSDVMMPEMDGFETCQHLKNDISTNHIPVVLLTAKSDAESRIQGLEQGADAYLPKPFYEKELLATLKNLLENREKLRQHHTSAEFFGQAVMLAKTTLNTEALTSRDEQFLHALLSVVQLNIAHPNLTAELLAEQLHISYNSLFRKVKALTGMGVTEYVRHIRLHQAATLLAHPNGLSVSQIAQEVGFNNLSFFSREFKKVLGSSPKEYRAG